MKTTRAARRLVKTRFIAICLAIGAVCAIEIELALSVSSRIGQTTGVHAESAAFPTAGISDLMAAAR
jgi:hypothetical protein